MNKQSIFVFLQNIKIIMKKIFQLFAIAILSIACSKSDNGVNEPDNSFNRNALLTNWANNIIIPSYIDYQTKTSTLVNDVNTFNANPNANNLQIVRNSWIAAYKSYQYISMYNIGKATDIYLKEATNTFPTDIIAINANIASGTYDLTKFSQWSKIGLPALDYLINGLGTNDADIIAFYSTNANAVNYKKYLFDVSNKLKFDANSIVDDWNSGFKTAYIANDGTSVNSSVNKTTNNFVKNLEKDIRTNKLGIPAGIFSAGTLYPNKVEAFYKNDISKILLNESLKAAKDFFIGKHFNSNTTGESLKSYLDFLNSNRNNQKLSDIINDQFALVLTTNNNLNNSFSNQVSNDNSKMLDAYNVLQQNVVYTKLDMMQALNISIDYVDGDGD